LRRGQSGDASGQDKGDEEAGLRADWQKKCERKFKNDRLSIEVFDKLDD